MLDLSRRDGWKPPSNDYGEPPPLIARNDELDPLALVRIARRRFWLIVGVGALVVAAALPAIMALRPIYQAQTRILIQPPLGASLNALDGEGPERMNVVTEVERLRARDISEAVIRELRLDELEEFNPALREHSSLASFKAFLQALLSGRRAVGEAGDPLRFVLPEYAAALDVARDPSSNVVEISFSSHDPEIAAAAPGAVLHAYVASREAHTRGQIDELAQWLDARLVEQRARAEAADAAASGAADDDADGLSSRAQVVQVIAGLIERRSEAAQQRAELVATLAAIDAAGEGAAASAGAVDAEVARLSRELMARRQEHERLLAVYGDRYPLVVEARRAVEDAGGALDAEIERHRRGVERKIAILEEQDRAAEAGFIAAQAALAREEQAEAARRQLLRTAEWERAELERLKERARALVIRRKLPVSDIEVLTPASLPVSPTGRGRIFFLVLAAVVGGAAGLTAATVAEMLDRTIRSLEQVRAIPGLAPAAMAPKLPRRVAARLADRYDPSAEGPFQHAVRGLALALEESNDGRVPTSILMTSAAPSEGKSTLAMALAMELATGRGMRVLLVDTDMRRGHLHRSFGLDAMPGLSELLAGKCAFEDAVRPTATPGLSCLPHGGPMTATHGEGVGRAVVDLARSFHDVVVFDGLPVLASGRALSLAREVERVVLVARWARTRLNSVELAAEQLQIVRRDRALVAVNGVDPRRHALYGYKDADFFLKALRQYQQGGAA